MNLWLVQIGNTTVGSDDDMRTLDRIRQAIHRQMYRISSHANEEMSEDEIEAKDIEGIALTGKILRKFTRGPRGTRYEVTGKTADGRRAAIICRFLPSGILLIITAYAEEEQEEKKDE